MNYVLGVHRFAQDERRELQNSPGVLVVCPRKDADIATKARSRHACRIDILPHLPLR